MTWERTAPGVYEHADGYAVLVFIPAHWELAVDENIEAGESATVSDHPTLNEGKHAYEKEDA